MNPVGPARAAGSRHRSYHRTARKLAMIQLVEKGEIYNSVVSVRCEGMLQHYDRHMFTDVCTHVSVRTDKLREE